MDLETRSKRNGGDHPAAIQLLIAMRRGLFIAIFTIALALTSGASDQLAFEMQKNAEATIYNLRLRQGDEVLTIWSERVPLIDGKEPNYWCNLSGWSKNQHGLLALVENNEFFWKLLQFDSNSVLVAEIDGVGGWLQDIRRGGSIKLEPPDKIEATGPDGTTNRFLIRDGRFADENGRIFEEPQSLQISLQGSQTAAQTSTSSTVPAAMSDSVPPASVVKVSPKAMLAEPTPSEEPASSTPWSVIVVLLVAATGLLWLVLKGKRRQGATI